MIPILFFQSHNTDPSNRGKNQLQRLDSFFWIDSTNEEWIIPPELIPNLNQYDIKESIHVMDTNQVESIILQWIN